MTGATHKGTRGRIEYRCSSAAPGGPARCGKVTIRAGLVEDLVGEEIAQRFAAYRHEPADDQEAELLASIEVDGQRLKEVGELYADGSIGPETLKAAVERLEARIAATSRRLAKSTLEIPEGADAIREAWAERSTAWKRRLVERTIEFIQVRPTPTRGGVFDGSRVSIRWRDARAPSTP